MQSFEEYKKQFAGLCTDDAALELWILTEVVKEPDSPALVKEVHKTWMRVRYGYT